MDLKDILNSRQNRPKNKLVRENAVTRVHGICSLRLCALNGRADKTRLTFTVFCLVSKRYNKSDLFQYKLEGGAYNQMYFICQQVDGVITARGLWADVKKKVKSVIHWNH